MRNIPNFKLESIPHWQIVAVLTSEPDCCDMHRFLLAYAPYPDYEYTLIEGYHCSCYNFDDTTWHATGYARDELHAVLRKWLEHGTDIERNFAHIVIHTMQLF